ncbi:MAG: response regulator transcription factor [Ramlibacter sp.]|nr:response regulator transcription factor [Ramlibacter sp.]
MPLRQLMFPIKVAVLHEDALVSAGVASTLATQSDIEIDRLPAMDMDPGVIHADVLVADFGTALSYLLTPHRAARAPRVLVVTNFDTERHVRHALKHGAQGYLLASCTEEQLVEAVRQLRRGQSAGLAAVVDRHFEANAPRPEAPEPHPRQLH